MTETDAKKELEALFEKPKPQESTPVPVTKEPPMAAKRGRAPKGEMSVKDMIIASFKGDPDKEQTIEQIYERVKVKSPKVPLTSVRSTTTALLAKGFLKVTRKEGRNVIIKLGTGTQPEAITAVQGRAASSVAPKGLKIDKNDIRALEEAIRVVQKYQALFSEIERIKSLL